MEDIKQVKNIDISAIDLLNQRIVKTRDLFKLDKALLNAILSFAVYTDKKEDFFNNISITSKYAKKLAEIDPEEFDKLKKRMLGEFKDIETTREAYMKVVSRMFHEFLEPVKIDIPKTKFKSDMYGYEYEGESKNGEYTSLDNLGKAFVFQSKDPEGNNVLHVAYRGTDTNANSFKKFFVKAYLDMDAYSDSFKPFEEAILNYAADPKNNIKKIEVCGHSLGGSPAARFIESDMMKAFVDKTFKEKNGVSVEGFTFGAPGHKKHEIISVFPALYHAIFHKKPDALFEFLDNVVYDKAKVAYETLKESAIYVKEKLTQKNKFKAFLEIGATVLDSLNTPVNIKIKNINITEYRHAADIVPIVGGLSSSNAGKVEYLKDYKAKEKEEFSITGDMLLKNTQIPSNAKEAFSAFKSLMEVSEKGVLGKSIHFIKEKWKKFSETAAHDNLRYIVNIQEKSKEILENCKKTDPNFKCDYINVTHAMTEGLSELETILKDKFVIKDKKTNEFMIKPLRENDVFNRIDEMRKKFIKIAENTAGNTIKPS